MAVKSKGSFSRVSAFFKRQGYLRFGNFAERSLINRGSIGFVDFNKIQKSMKQANIEISLRGWIGMSLFATLIVTIVALFSSIFISSFILITSYNMNLFIVVFIIGIIVSGLLGFGTFYILVKYPNMRIKSRAVALDAALPTVASYMSAMTSAGVPPAPIFASLASEKISTVVTQECERINRDIEILGLDVLRALEAAAYRSPSERWAGFLEGMIATVNSGGDLTQYLSTETKAFMKLKQEKTKEFIENLGVLAEIFMVVGVVTPLFFVVLVAILSILSAQSSQGTFGLLILITYILIPAFMVAQYILTTLGDTEEV
ncbi:MAG: type II secretion system F family protein [Candidatus Thorarchaeota archaeon]